MVCWYDLSSHIGLSFIDYVSYLLIANYLQIFTEDMAEVEALPRGEVLNFLERTAKNLVIPYLVISQY